jgi:hypothetical protein
MDILAVLLDQVVHRGSVPRLAFGELLLREVDAEGVLVGRRAALPVRGPAVGVVAAADDAVMADDVVTRGVGGRDRQAVDLSLIGHGPLPQSLNAK